MHNHILMIPSEWPTDVSPFLEEAHVSTRDLALSLGLLQPQDLQKYDKENYVLLTALAFPQTDPEPFKLCNDWMSFLFFFDDEVDEQADLGQKPAAVQDYANRCLDVLRTGSAPKECGGLEKMALDMRKRMLGFGSEAWYRRFVEDVEDYMLHGVLVACVNWSQGSVPALEEYRLHRRSDSALYTFLDLIEISKADLELSPAVVNDPAFREMRDLCTDAAALTNDFFSYEKEVLVHGNPNNLLHVLMMHESLTLAQAKSRAIDLINEDVRKFSAAEQRFIASQGSDHKTQAYIYGMKAWIKGNVTWSVQTGRYAGVTPEARTLCTA